MNLIARTAVGLVTLLVATLGLGPLPASALEQPRLLGASIGTTDTAGPGSPKQVATTLRLAGSVGSVRAVWALLDGSTPVQQVDSGGYGVAPGATEVDLTFTQSAFHLQGSWVLWRVTVQGTDGATAVKYGDGAPAAIPGGAPGFVLDTGPASLTDVGNSAGTVTGATLTAPAGDPRTVANGGTLTTAIDYTNSAPGTSAYMAVYRSTTGGILRSLSSVQPGLTNGTTNVSVTVSQSWFVDGQWSLDRIVVLGGPVYRVYLADGTVRTKVQTVLPLSGSGTSCGAGFGDDTPPAGCVELTAGAHALGLGTTFDITGVGNREYVAPALTGAALSAPSVAAGGQVTLSATYTDTTSQPRSNQQLIASFDGQGTGFSSVTPATVSCTPSAPYTCTVSAVVNVPAGARNGTYTGAYVTTYDSVGNSATYAPTTLSTSTWKTQTGPVPDGQLDVSSLTFTVTGGLAKDGTAPTLTSFVRTSGVAFDVNGVEQATWHWAGSDGTGTGISQVSVELLSPSTGGVTSAAWNPTGPDVSGTSGDITLIPNSVGEGDWVVRSVTVRDRRGNVRRYDADGAVAPGSTTHAFGLATAGVLVLNGTPGDVPSAPRALTVSGRDQTLVARWSAPASAGGSAVTSYDVVLQPGGITQSGLTGTSAVFTGLTNEIGYTVSVRAHNADGPGATAWSPGVWVHPVAPLSAPSLRAWPEVSRTSTLTLHASAPPTQVGAPVTGYRTQVRMAPAGERLPTAWRNHGPVRATPSATITGVSKGTRVCARVVPLNTVGTGPASAARCTVVLADERSLTRSAGWVKVSRTTAYAHTLLRSTTVGAALVSKAAYGHTVYVAAQAVPGGGTIAVLVGAKRVATIRLAAAASRSVVRGVPATVAGKPITLRVVRAGTGGVTIDGYAVGG